MILTMTKASQITGKSISTIYRAIKNGQLSATHTHDGKKGVEISELSRVWPLKYMPDDDNAKNEKITNENLTGHRNQSASSQVSSQEFAALKESLEFIKNSLDDAREERLRLMDIIEKLQVRLLPAPTEEKKQVSMITSSTPKKEEKLKKKGKGKKRKKGKKSK